MSAVGRHLREAAHILPVRQLRKVGGGSGSRVLVGAPGTGVAI